VPGSVGLCAEGGLHLTWATVCAKCLGEERINVSMAMFFKLYFVHKC
jgi:hypothetical protein